MTGHAAPSESKPIWPAAVGVEFAASLVFSSLASLTTLLVPAPPGVHAVASSPPDEEPITSPPATVPDANPTVSPRSIPIAAVELLAEQRLPKSKPLPGVVAVESAICA